MSIKTFSHNYLLQFLAMIALFLALRDAASLLGINSGNVSPVVQIGLISFVLMGAFTIFRLFASVGMWIGAGWGAPLQVLITAIELILVFISSEYISILTIGLTIRILLLVGIGIWVILHYSIKRSNIYD